MLAFFLIFGLHVTLEKKKEKILEGYISRRSFDSYLKEKEAENKKGKKSKENTFIKNCVIGQTGQGENFRHGKTGPCSASDFAATRDYVVFSKYLPKSCTLRTI